jgi:hypothetical protein
MVYEESRSWGVSSPTNPLHLSSVYIDITFTARGLSPEDSTSVQLARLAQNTYVHP